MDNLIERRRYLLASLGGLAAAGLVPRLAMGQAGFPNKTMRLVIPYAPGGSTDAMARLVAKKLSDRTGQQCIVENKPGANAAIGISEVARAVPDGYTILLSNESVVLNPLLDNAPVTTLAQLQPIAQVAGLPVSLYANADWGVRTMPEFLARLKASPGKFNHGTGGPATRVISETFKSFTKLEYEEVSYKGLGPTMLGLIAGEVQFVFSDPASAAPHVKSGKIVQVGVASVLRSAAQEGVSAMSEFVPGFGVRSFGGVFGPHGLPRPITETLNAHLRAVIADPEIVARFNDLGIVAASGTPEGLGEIAQGLSDEMAKVIKERKIKFT